MTPAKLKRLRRVLEALKQTEMAQLAALRGQQEAADARAARHRATARRTFPAVDAADLKMQAAWTRAELGRADAEDMARQALAGPIADAAAKLARTFGREAALKALSEKLDREIARDEERKAEAALSWMQAGPRTMIGSPRRDAAAASGPAGAENVEAEDAAVQDAEVGPPGSSSNSSSTGVA